MVGVCYRCGMVKFLSDNIALFVSNIQTSTLLLVLSNQVPYMLPVDAKWR